MGGMMNGVYKSQTKIYRLALSFVSRLKILQTFDYRWYKSA